MKATMKTKKSMKTIIAFTLAVSLCSSVCLAQSNQYPNQQTQDPNSKGIFLAALAPAVANQLVSVFSQGAGCVFSRIFSFLGANDNPSCKSPQQAANNAPTNNQFQANAAAPAVAAPTASNAAVLATQPVISLIVQKLASEKPNADVLNVLLSTPKLEQGAEPEFNIQTGEAFAVLFSTTVPGRVQLINTDANQVISKSDVYEAIPGGDNRMPRLQQGGILMAGTPGAETLDIVFEPCISAQYLNHPSVQPFVGSLNACTGNGTKQFSPTQIGAKGGASDTSKAMVFATSGDPSQPVAVAPPTYTKGGELRLRLKINHVPSGA